MYGVYSFIQGNGTSYLPKQLSANQISTFKSFSGTWWRAWRSSMIQYCYFNCLHNHVKWTMTCQNKTRVLCHAVHWTLDTYSWNHLQCQTLALQSGRNRLCTIVTFATLYQCEQYFWSTNIAKPENITSLGLFPIKYQCHQVFSFSQYMSFLMFPFVQNWSYRKYIWHKIANHCFTWYWPSRILPMKLHLTFLPWRMLYEGIICPYFLFNIIINFQHCNTSQHYELYLRDNHPSETRDTIEISQQASHV